MRVLFLNPTGILGGAERCLLDLAASMQAASPGIEIGLVAGGDGALLDEARALGIRVIHVPLGSAITRVGDSALRRGGPRETIAAGGRLGLGAMAAARYVWPLNEAVRSFGPSIVHSNGIKMHLLATAVRKRSPLVWHIRDFIGDRPLIPFGMRATSWRADAGLAISRAVQDDARRIMPHLPIEVVHDAVDTDSFSPEGPRADLDALAGNAGPATPFLRVGLVATYARWKGHDVFLRAVRLIDQEPGLPRVRFYIVGGPVYDTIASQYWPEELHSLARDLGIEHCVSFVPFQHRIHDVMRALDVVVHASTRAEPFGRTIAEGMAAGKAVVASRDSGAAEIFVDGVEAIAVEPRDPEALATALRALLVDASLRNRLGHAARLAAVERFSRPRLAEQVFRVYRMVMAQRPWHPHSIANPRSNDLPQNMVRQDPLR
ncbi:MAG: glycosyltransferase family 4 protein [Polyangiaceae bacterium]